MFNHEFSILFVVEGNAEVENYFTEVGKAIHAVTDFNDQINGSAAPAEFSGFFALFDDYHPGAFSARYTHESGDFWLGSDDEAHVFTITLYQHLAGIDPDVVVTSEWVGDWWDFGRLRLARLGDGATVQIADYRDCGLPADPAECLDLDADVVERALSQLPAQVLAAPPILLEDFIDKKCLFVPL